VAIEERQVKSASLLPSGIDEGGSHLLGIGTRPIVRNVNDVNKFEMFMTPAGENGREHRQNEESHGCVAEGVIGRES